MYGRMNTVHLTLCKYVLMLVGFFNNNIYKKSAFNAGNVDKSIWKLYEIYTWTYIISSISEKTLMLSIEN